MPAWPGQPWFPYFWRWRSIFPLFSSGSTNSVISRGPATPFIETRLITLTAWKLSGRLHRQRPFIKCGQLVVGGVRPATQAAYQSDWAAWDKAYNTINIAHSMLSGTLSPIDGQHGGPTLLSHETYMKGIYNSKPPEPRTAEKRGEQQTSLHCDSQATQTCNLKGHLAGFDIIQSALDVGRGGVQSGDIGDSGRHNTKNGALVERGYLYQILLRKWHRKIYPEAALGTSKNEIAVN
ncbi:hypothetical protein OUZ56_012240 [Daphnia magna]|uniref:Uncharacterized protein n=1 Tax=Daphnia magna TaxID=35525 RepID=A0ABQ9Z2M2_9CRUS|nr:hypothetical protein OUZ56_012240 [Daphnia magna]